MPQKGAFSTNHANLKVVKKKITAADGNLAQLNITGKKLEETFNINYIHKM